MTTTVRFSDELQTHSRSGPLWTTFKRLPPLRGDQALVSTHSFGGRDYKGGKLPEFFGTVESDAFTVTKRKKDWLSGLTGNVIFEITLKKCGTSLTNMAMRYDFYNSFRVKDILDLRLTRDDRTHNFKFKIEGTCAADHQDLGEVIACLLLHHNEEQGASS